jgi:hypothetical protein
MASAIDDAGFEIRDTFMWLYTQNQAKAMSVNHFIKKVNNEAYVKIAERRLKELDAEKFSIEDMPIVKKQTKLLCFQNEKLVLSHK